MRHWFPRVLIAAVALVGCTDQGDATDATVATTTGSAATATSAPSTTEPGPDVDDFGSIPSGAAGEATGPLGSTELRIETGAGAVQIGSGSVPEGLDPAFPIPPDFVLELASETDTDLGFSGTTRLSFDDLIELYEVGLTGAGYEMKSIERRGSEFALFEFADGVGLGEVAISEASSGIGYTVIVVFGDGDGDEVPPEN